MKPSPRPFLVLAALVAATVLLPGCAMITTAAMNKQNEKDLLSGRQSTAEYRARRDEIDRRLR